MMRSVYVIRSEIGSVKVGIASNARGRLCHLRSGSPVHLALEWLGETDAAAEIEARAHAILAESRSRGEWFSVSVAQAVEAVMQAATELGHEIRLAKFAGESSHSKAGQRQGLDVPQRRPKGSGREPLIGIRMSLKLTEGVDAFALAHGITRSAAARMLIERALARAGYGAAWE